MTHDQIPRSTDSALAPSPDLRRLRDVVVIGGGAAGLSAALTLARARRDVLVVDAGQPRNAPAEGVHGFLTRDGISPLELTRLGRADVESYGGDVVAGVASNARTLPADSAGRFAVTVTTADGETAEVHARRLVVATGLTDELPPIPGLAERWGRDVVHCPYCHGWEIRDRAIGVLATGPMAVHQALLFRQWSDDVTLFLHEQGEQSEQGDQSELTDEQWEQLAARNIAVVTGPVGALRIEDDQLTGVALASGRTVAIGALVVGVPVRANAEVLEGLGIVPDDHPQGFGTAVPSDPLTGATTVPGVWVAGNVTEMKLQVISAAAAGVWAGAMANSDLILEETETAVAARRDPFSASAEAANTTAVLGDRRHGLERVR
jgi:thioredoxin reductase